MQGIQKKYGKDKLEILLLSVDASYGNTVEAATELDAKTIKKHGIDWSNVIAPDGWDGIHKRFNIQGYGLMLIGPDGIVLGKDIRHRELETLLKKLYN